MYDPDDYIMKKYKDKLFRDLVIGTLEILALPVATLLSLVIDIFLSSL